ncbi:MAG TPA: ABC transporter substrate-binding protein [Afifellaceae bacterium]|nr:ABC transporter substrate-binding protein [Afifellaceae bacterium]
MTIKIRRAVAAAAFAAAMGVSGWASAQERFTFIFPVDSMVQYHPFHIAKQLGFYEEEGLDVQFEASAGSSAAMQQLIAGNADGALPSPAAYLNAVAQGHDARWVFSYEYGNVFTLVVPADSDIQSIEDLSGKSLGVSELSGGEVPMVRAVLRRSGLEEGTDVTLVPVGEGSALTVRALQTGQVDAYSSSVFDVAALNAAGIQTRVILPEDVQDYPANGVVVMADTLENKSEQVAGFLRASAKGIVYALANKEKAFAMASELGPEEFEDENYAREGLQALYSLMERPEALTDAPLGAHYEKGFQDYHDFLRQGSEEEGALPQDVDLSTALDDSLVEAANDFDRQAIEQMAQQ